MFTVFVIKLQFSGYLTVISGIKTMACFLILAVGVAFSSYCFADGFSDTVDIGGIKFTQYEVDDDSERDLIIGPDRV